MLRHHCLQLIHTLLKILLFSIFFRCLVEVSQCGIDVPVGIGRVSDGSTSGTSATGITGGCHTAARIEQVVFITVRTLILRPGIAKQRSEVLDGPVTVFLFRFQRCLLVGFLLVTDDDGIGRERHFRIETRSGLFLLLILRRWREYQPHRAEKHQTHQRIDEHLLPPLPLFMRKRLFRGIALFPFRRSSNQFIQSHRHHVLVFHNRAVQGTAAPGVLYALSASVRCLSRNRGLPFQA